MRAHNIEFLIWERLTDNENNLFKRYYLRYLTKKLKRYEIKIIDYIDGIIAISSVDKIFFDTLKSGTAVTAIPYAIDIEEGSYFTSPVKSTPFFYHLGSMNWLPNLEAVYWLLKEVWPVVVKRKPEAVISIAGRNMPEDIVAFSNNSVSVESHIKSIEEYLSDKHVLLAPIFSGSGIRIKILEAMSYGKLVITTAIGAEGIDYEDGKDILIAETVEQFVEKILAVCNNPAMINTIGQHARQTITGNYDLLKVSKKLEVFMQGFLS
jgi:glycosyltransferase involved in cell wall biosynthesis